MTTRPPLVSVIIPTYNRSASLHYAIKSVLLQTIQDFELLVIGDACTDDSEEVVRAFGDNRIHWHNLPENSGSQGVPNQKGNELASGQYIAYLGHDDLWFPNHLEELVGAFEDETVDVAYPLELIVFPDERRLLFGLSPHGQYFKYQSISPTGIMHKHDTVQDVGGWRDYRLIDRPADIDLFIRLYEAGKTFRYVPALTVVKIPASRRRDIYLDDDGSEQAYYLDQVQHNPDPFRYRELMQVLQSAVDYPHLDLLRIWRPRSLGIGEQVDTSRIVRGLPPQAKVNMTPLNFVPIYENLTGLEVLNRENDITPLRYRRALYDAGQIPRNGLLLGSWWEPPIYSRWGDTWRNPSSGAEIVVTNPRQPERYLMVELQAAKKRSLIFEIKNMADQTVAKIQFSKRSFYVVPLQFRVGQGTVYRVFAYPSENPEEDAGKDCLVHELDWFEPTDAQKTLIQQMTSAYAEVVPNETVIVPAWD